MFLLLYKVCIEWYAEKEKVYYLIQVIHDIWGAGESIVSYSYESIAIHIPFYESIMSKVLIFNLSDLQFFWTPWVIQSIV